MNKAHSIETALAASAEAPHLRTTCGYARAPSLNALEIALLVAATTEDAADILNADMQTAPRPRKSSEIEDLDRIAVEIDWLAQEQLATTVAPELVSALGLNAGPPTTRLRRILVSAYADAERIASLQAQERKDLEIAQARADELGGIITSLRSGMLFDIGILERRTAIDCDRAAEFRQDFKACVESLEEMAAEFRQLGNRISAPGNPPQTARFYFILRLMEAFILSTGQRLPKRVTVKTEDATKPRTPDHPFLRFIRRALDLTGLGLHERSPDDILRQITKGRAPGRKPRETARPDLLLDEEQLDEILRLKKLADSARSLEERVSYEKTIAIKWAEIEEREFSQLDLKCAERLDDLLMWTAQSPNERTILQISALPSYSLETEMRGTLRR